MARKSATRMIRLGHHCRLPGCEGNRGDVVEVPEDKARLLIERRGAAYIDNEPTVEAPSDEGEEQ